jgi:hypothetical protein
MDNPTSNALTREALGCKQNEPELLTGVLAKIPPCKMPVGA